MEMNGGYAKVGINWNFVTILCTLWSSEGNIAKRTGKYKSYLVKT